MKPEVLLVMDSSHEECGDLMHGISSFQAEHGAWHIFIDREARAEQDSEWVTSRPWSGVISRTTSPLLVDLCRKRGLPLVDLNDGPRHPGVPKVRPDNRAIGHMAAEDLHARGFHRLYFCGYTNQLWSLERGEGFMEAARLLGITAEGYVLPHGCSLAPAENARTIAVLSDWLRTIRSPSAVLAAHDLRAYQLLLAAEQAGISVPDELAVLGVNDDRTLCELCSPPLSSIAKNSRLSGYTAAGLLASLMKGEKVAAAEVLIEPERILARRSTDSIAVADRGISRALALIRERACERLTVADVMRHAAVSRDKLEKGFRRVLGRSPHAEIRRVRLARARELLLNTDLPLKEIADQAGFEYPEYFNVTFKRVFGQSPGRFRRESQSSCPAGLSAA